MAFKKGRLRHRPVLDLQDGNGRKFAGVVGHQGQADVHGVSDHGRIRSALGGAGLLVLQSAAQTQPRSRTASATRLTDTR